MSVFAWSLCICSIVEVIKLIHYKISLIGATAGETEGHPTVLPCSINETHPYHILNSSINSDHVSAVDFVLYTLMFTVLNRHVCLLYLVWCSDRWR